MNRVRRREAARRAASREHAVVHRAAALLLDYPDEELYALLPLVRDALADAPAPAAERLGHFLAHVERTRRASCSSSTSRRSTCGAGARST